jgi:hypothetical protein
VYSLIDFQLKFCLDSEFENQKILEISLSKKSKFFSIFYYNFNLDIYNLSEERKINDHCNCMVHMMAEQFAIGPVVKIENSINYKKSLKEKATNLFGYAFGKLKDYMFEKKRKSFCKYKFNPNNEIFDNSLLIDKSNLEHNYTILNRIYPNHFILVWFDRLNEIVRLYLKFILF